MIRYEIDIPRYCSIPLAYNQNECRQGGSRGIFGILSFTFRCARVTTIRNTIKFRHQATIPMDQQRFIAIDVETTGFSPSRGDRVIEVGAAVVENRRIVDEFQSLIYINKRIPRSATLIHGITNAMLDGQPMAEDVYPKLQTLFSGATLIAHNAQFDIRFLRHEFGRLGLGLNNRYCCTLEMCRKRFPRLPDHKLETVCMHLFGHQVEEVRMHRALDDARMVARVWMEMMIR